MKLSIIAKKGLSIATTLLLCSSAHSQDLSLLEFNEMRLKKTKAAMTILGSWSAANIVSGAILQANTTREKKYFHQMNAIWNGVNLAIAGLGYLNARKARAADFNLTKSIKEHHKFQKILLFNAGLDIGYMVGGLYLMERGKNQSEQGDRDQMRGFGKSIILQGGFLFVFDLITAWQLSKDNPKLHNLLNSMSFDGQRIGFSMRF